MSLLLRFLPIGLFAILALGIFIHLFSTNWQATKMPPDIMRGQIMPTTTLPLLEGPFLGEHYEDKNGQFDLAAMQGRVRLVNFWGSWCAPCRLEHAQLMQLAQDKRFDLLGINYKDSQANAVAFLAEMGNPFKQVGVDKNGRAAIDWGVYGVPETYLLDENGRILYRHIGPITQDDLYKQLLPEIEKAVK